MSIENNLKRIADALEALVAGGTSLPATVAEVPKQPVAPAPVAVVSSTPVTPAPVVAAPPVAPVAPATPAPIQQAPVVTPAAVGPSVAGALSPEELNAALVAEFTRLGSREPIDAVMRAAPFNAQSITDLTPEQYLPLINAIRTVSA